MRASTLQRLSPRRSTLLPIISLLIGLVVPAPISAQGPDLPGPEDQPDRLTLDLYLEWQDVSSPQLSPDGREIIYTRSRIDKVNDRRVSSIWIMDADGSRNRFLVDGSSPKWSPDGTRIAYIAPGEPRGAQIHIRWMDDEGAVSQITHLDRAPSGISWSPDGNQIAFTMLVPKREGWPIDLPARPEGARWTEAPRIVTALHYRRDRSG